MSVYNTELYIENIEPYTGFFSFLAVIEAVLEKIEILMLLRVFLGFIHTYLLVWRALAMAWKRFLHIKWAVVTQSKMSIFVWMGVGARNAPVGFSPALPLLSWL